MRRQEVRRLALISLIMLPGLCLADWEDDQRRTQPDYGMRESQFSFGAEKYLQSVEIKQQNIRFQQEFMKRQRESADYQLFAPAKPQEVEKITPQEIPKVKPQEVKVQEVSPKIEATKSKSGWQKASDYANATLVGCVVVPFAQSLGAVINAIASVASLGHSVRTGFKSEQSVTRFKAAAANLWNSLTGIAGTFVGHVLKHVPVRSVQGFGQKISNWSKGHGWGFTDAKLKQMLMPKDGKTILAYQGIGNGVTQVASRKPNGDPVHFREHQARRFREGYKDTACADLAKQVDFLPVYTGNLGADAVYTAFEKSGWGVVSSFVKENFSGRGYQAVVGHSGGAAFHRGNKDLVKADVFVMVGAPGTDQGWYVSGERVLAHERDPVPHVTPQDHGRSIGFSYDWGRGGADRVKPVSNPLNPSDVNPHSFERYMAEVFRWLKR